MVRVPHAAGITTCFTHDSPETLSAVMRTPAASRVNPRLCSRSVEYKGEYEHWCLRDGSSPFTCVTLFHLHVPCDMYPVPKHLSVVYHAFHGMLGLYYTILIKP